MASLTGPVRLAATGTTGNNDHAACRVEEGVSAIAWLLTVEVVGATPTVTAKLQGSMDGTNWFDLLSIPADNDTGALTVVASAVGASARYLAQAQVRFAKYVRLSTSANTNVTYKADLYTSDRN